MDFESEWKKVPDLILQFENELKNKRNRVLWYPNLFHHLNDIFFERFPDCYCEVECKCADYKPESFPLEKEMAQMVLAALEKYQTYLKKDKELLDIEQSTVEGKVLELNQILKSNKTCVVCNKYDSLLL